MQGSGSSQQGSHELLTLNFLDIRLRPIWPETKESQEARKKSKLGCAIDSASRAFVTSRQTSFITSSRVAESFLSRRQATESRSVTKPSPRARGRRVWSLFSSLSRP